MKGKRLIYSHGIDRTRYNCYDEGWYEEWSDVLTFTKGQWEYKFRLLEEEYIILSGEIEGRGYNPPLKQHFRK